METEAQDARTQRMDRWPRVVIVGGGFGGLYAAKSLAHAPVRVTIIDRHNYHLFRPMLYQVATGLLPAEEIAAPIRSILRSQKNAEVLLAEVTGVDTERKRVLMGRQSLSYDFLILATGIHYNYFGHDEWAEFAPGPTSVDDAARIRAKILQAFEVAEERAAEGASPDEIAEWLTFVLVGGGTTGVEMAGALAELTRASLAGDFRHIDPRKSRILLIEAGPRLLSNYPEELAEKARRRLERMGVEVRTGAAVAEIDAEGVLVAGQRIRSRTVIWAAGVTASAAGRWLGAAMDKNGKVKVESDLTVPGHPDVFVIGDTASVVAPWRNLLGIPGDAPEPLPGVAQPAIQGGEYVASVIRRRVRGLRPPAPFSYWDKGDLAIVGRSFAVANLKVARFWGFIAWVLWLSIHIYYLIGFGNRLLVLTQWAISFFTNRRDVRILPPESEAAPAPQATP